MNEELLQNYQNVQDRGGFYETKRGLIKVWGKEAVQFLNGLITNDVAKLEENTEMLAAFPNAQGRLLAVVRVIKKDGVFLFETEEITSEKVFQNLFRFTFAGDFFVEDLTGAYRSFIVQDQESVNSRLKDENLNPEIIAFNQSLDRVIFVPIDSVTDFLANLKSNGAAEISDELSEIFRIESGIPRYGVDMDETTIVPELGIDGLISYQKGCYIGQEIIARIYFRGHVAKKMTGLILSESASDSEVNNLKLSDLTGTELESLDGKKAGKITSVTFSPGLGQTIALAYVRYDYLAENTSLKIDDIRAEVKDLPFDKN